MKKHITPLDVFFNALQEEGWWKSAMRNKRLSATH